LKKIYHITNHQHQPFSLRNSHPTNESWSAILQTWNQQSRWRQPDKLLRFPMRKQTKSI